MIQKPNIAIVTYDQYAPPNEAWIDDLMLRQKLLSMSCNVDIADWQSDKLKFHSYNKIFISTAWNVPRHYNQFKDWLLSCESDGKKRVLNSIEAILFSLNKDNYYNYFNSHIPNHLIPTLFLYDDKNNFDEFYKICTNEGLWNNASLVIKPIISADGFNTFIYKRNGQDILNADRRHVLNSKSGLNKLYKEVYSEIQNHKGLMIQPYLRGIEQGEYSITFIDCELVLCIKKPDGFRNCLSKNRVAIDIDKIDKSLILLCDNIVNILLKKFNKSDLSRFRLDFIKEEQSYFLSEIELAEPNCNFSVINQSSNKYNEQDLIDRLSLSILRSVGQNHQKNMRV